MAIPFFAQADLEDAIGIATVRTIFDEDGGGTVAPRAMASCITYGTTECCSFMRATYPDAVLPSQVGDTVPDELKNAALDFGIAYAMRRRPDIVKAMGEEPWTTFETKAIEKMERYGKTQQRLPRATGTPSNVGATIGESDGTVTRTTAGAPSPCAPARVFDDMGDFA